MKPPIYDPEWHVEVKAVYRHDIQEIWDPTIARHIWNQYHNQLRVYLGFAEIGGPLDVLDVGCAQGTLALLLGERGHRVLAVDIRQQFLDYARSRYEHGAVRFVCGNVLEIELAERFDLIYANQIVEHLVYPCAFTQRLARWLKPGGRLVMTTPNGRYLKNPLPSFSEIGDHAVHEARQFTADADGHFFAYRDEELLEVFAHAGLRETRVRYFETPWISGHMKVRYMHVYVPVAALKLLDRMTLGVPWLAKHLAHQLLIVGSAP